jgi:protein required for attachment to host cells
MPKLSIETGDWVVVCDGSKALILENAGDSVFPDLRTKEVREQDGLATRQRGSDTPGRVHQSEGRARSSVDQTDWHDQAERIFLEGVVARLFAALKDGETSGLIVVAPPRALGMLRIAYPNAIRAAIKAEVDKDYVKLPLHEIEGRLVRSGE